MFCLQLYPYVRNSRNSQLAISTTQSLLPLYSLLANCHYPTLLWCRTGMLSYSHTDCWGSCYPAAGAVWSHPPWKLCEAVRARTQCPGLGMLLYRFTQQPMGFLGLSLWKNHNVAETLFCMYRLVSWLCLTVKLTVSIKAGHSGCCQCCERTVRPVSSASLVSIAARWQHCATK